jgi:hypothetical protein
MAIAIIIVCVIAYAFVHASMADQGIGQRSRGSLRYQRRKGRREGLNPEYVLVKSHRTVDQDVPQPTGDSHVSDLAFSLITTFWFLILLISGGMFMAARHVPGDWFWVWLTFLWLCVFGLHRWRQHRHRHRDDIDASDEEATAPPTDTPS